MKSSITIKSSLTIKDSDKSKLSKELLSQSSNTIYSIDTIDSIKDILERPQLVTTNTEAKSESADYVGVRLSDDIVIRKLYTVHYYEYSKEYSFTGEKHDFWELVYVDKGIITAVADDKSIVLKQGNVIFHKPNEWHNLYANGTIAPNIAIITFACDSPCMKFFEEKILSVGQEQKELISSVIAEYTNAFSSPLNDPYTTKLIRRKNAPIGAEQMIKLSLSKLLISFMRSTPQAVQKTIPAVNYANSVLEMIINYMKENISGSISLKDLTAYSGTNRTAIENMFRENFSMGAVEFFLRLKIEAAKRYLREDNYNITQISEMLGYSGIHYFSRQFKKITNMTPTEYTLSIKAMIQEP